MRKPFLLLPVIALFLATMFLITCAKEYSYEGPLAQYTMEGSPAECAPAILSGNYFAGVAVDESNYLQITLDVTLRGFYMISTIPVDGISFSASGNFTDTGKQVIKLACAGTPDSSGSFTIKMGGNTTGCYITLKINNKAPSSYVLSGNPGDCSNPVIKGRYIQDKQVTFDDTVVLGVKVATPGTYRIKTDTANGVSFSASGYFPNTGNQTVTLTSKGTPGEAGRFYFNVYADSTQCNFSIPVEPILPAVYVLEYGYDTVCLHDTARGTYLSGVQLDNTNTVSFSVYATAVGNYSISTNKVNGMVFGTSGKFSVLGEQRMVLTGSGVPSATGTFLFRPFIIGPSPLGGNFCNFSVKVQ